MPVAGSGVRADRFGGGAPKSKLSTLSWWPDTTLGVDMDVAGASTDEVYAAMDGSPAAKTASRTLGHQTFWRRKPIVGGWRCSI